MEGFVNLILSIAVISFTRIIKISPKPIISFDELRFIKNCDALNFEFFIKNFSSNILDILINTLDILILADIL